MQFECECTDVVRQWTISNFDRVVTHEGQSTTAFLTAGHDLASNMDDAESIRRDAASYGRRCVGPNSRFLFGENVESTVVDDHV